MYVIYKNIFACSKYFFAYSSRFASTRKDRDLLEGVQRRGTETVSQLEHLSYEEGLSWGCSAWRREGSRETPSVYKGGL